MCSNEEIWDPEMNIRDHSSITSSLLETFSTIHTSFLTATSFGTLPVGSAYLITNTCTRKEQKNLRCQYNKAIKGTLLL